MKWKAQYDAESDVPDEVKQFFKLEKGKWVFDNQFEGLAEMLNPALEANKNQILEEKRRAVEAKEKADQRVQTQDIEIQRLEGEVKKLQQPGTVAISDSDNKMFEEYKELGAPKDIKTKLDNEVALANKLTGIETREEIRTLAKKLGLDEDALVDFKLNNERGKELQLKTITRKEKDNSGKEVEKELLAVVETDTVNGKAKEIVTEFSEYATQKNFPKYLVDAIFNASGEKRESRQSGFRTTPSMRSKTESAGDTESIVSKKTKLFNERRSTRQLPWSAQKKSE